MFGSRTAEIRQLEALVAENGKFTAANSLSSPGGEATNGPENLSKIDVRLDRQLDLTMFMTIYSGIVALGAWGVLLAGEVAPHFTPLGEASMAKTGVATLTSFLARQGLKSWRHVNSQIQAQRVEALDRAVSS